MKINKIKKKEILFLTIIFAALFIVVYSGCVLYRTIHLYSYIKSNPRGWVGRVHKADRELGLAPIPGADGAEVFSIGPEIPIRYDNRGFRVPLGSAKTSPPPRPLVLALGDSWTYGAACLAENTYPYLVGHLIGGSSINGGVSSYGLSQMLILARRLIPTYKPDYVLVQFSPWLVSRARRGFAPTYFGKLPTPYFFEAQGKLKLYPPLFKTKLFDVPISKYRGTERSILDFISFQFLVALPLFAYEDLNMSIYYTKRFLRMIPAPADGQVIMRDVYKEIMRIAEKNGSKAIIVILGKDNKIDTDQDPNVVNAHSALIERLPAKNPKLYSTYYNHWRFSPTKVVVDHHPNAYAHSIIAEAIVNAIGNKGAVLKDPNLGASP